MSYIAQGIFLYLLTEIKHHTLFTYCTIEHDQNMILQTRNINWLRRNIILSK